MDAEGHVCWKARRLARLVRTPRSASIAQIAEKVHPGYGIKLSEHCAQLAAYAD